MPLESLTSKRHRAFAGGPFGSNLKSSDYTPYGIPVIQLSNITEDYLDFSQRLIFTSKRKADELNASNAYPDEIIIAKMMPAGRACLSTPSFPRYVLGSDAIRVSIDSQRTNLLFIKTEINTERIKAYVRERTTGSTRKRIGIPELKALPMAVPSKEEQEKVGKLLALIDQRIAVQNKIIEKLESLKKQLRVLFFTSEKFDDTEHRLGDYLIKTQCGKATSPKKNKLISVRLNEKGVCHNENVETLKMNGTVYYERKAGQFIYGKQNLHHGAIGIVPNKLDGFLSSGDIPSLEIVNIDPFLLLQIIGTQCSGWGKYASGTGSKRIHEDVLRAIKVSIPDARYCPSMSRLLKQIDGKIALEEKRAKLLSGQKKFLLENMFI